eukprot:6177393-Pleurochrysis_carterae.AAC.2
MSNWNKDEVDALRADMGGGNARNSATTFAHLPNESALWPKVPLPRACRSRRANVVHLCVLSAPCAFLPVLSALPEDGCCPSPAFALRLYAALQSTLPVAMPCLRTSQKGCHPNELKEFIVAAYNDRKWFGEAAPVEAPQPPRPKAPPSVSKTVSLPVKLEWSPIWRWLPPYGYLDPARAASIPQVSATMLASHSSLLRLFTRSYTSLAPLLVSLPA